MPSTFIARRRLLVGDSHREAGELVPEAADWPNQRNYVEIGWIERIADDDPEAIEAAQRQAESLSKLADNLTKHFSGESDWQPHPLWSAVAEAAPLRQRQLENIEKARASRGQAQQVA